MKRCVCFVVLIGCFGLSVAAFAQDETVVTSWDHGGNLTWTNANPNATSRVEWASFPTGAWQRTWTDLEKVETAGRDEVTVQVPRFFRVVTPANRQILEHHSVEEAGLLIRTRRPDPDFAILDVRTTTEYAGGHVVGAVNHDFYGAHFGRVLDLLDRDKTYLVYCRSGGRSGATVDMMATNGFNDVHNMLSGFSAFEEVPDHTDLIE